MKPLGLVLGCLALASCTHVNHLRGGTVPSLRLPNGAARSVAVVVGGDDVVARLGDVEDRVGDRGHARGRGNAALAAFQGREAILEGALRNLYDGVPIEEVYKASILAARTKIEIDPDYTYATSRLLLHTILKEVLGEEVTQADMATRYADYVSGSGTNALVFRHAVEHRLDPAEQQPNQIEEQHGHRVGRPVVLDLGISGGAETATRLGRSRMLAPDCCEQATGS